MSMAVDGNQQSDVSELSRELVSGEVVVDASQINNNLVCDEATDFNASKTISPVKGGVAGISGLSNGGLNGAANTINDTFREEASGIDASEMGPFDDVDAGFSECPSTLLPKEESSASDVKDNVVRDNDGAFIISTTNVSKEADDAGHPKTVTILGEEASGIDASDMGPFDNVDAKFSECPSTLLSKEESSASDVKDNVVRDNDGASIISTTNVSIEADDAGHPKTVTILGERDVVASQSRMNGFRDEGADIDASKMCSSDTLVHAGVVECPSAFVSAEGTNGGLEARKNDVSDKAIDVDTSEMTSPMEVDHAGYAGSPVVTISEEGANDSSKIKIIIVKDEAGNLGTPNSISPMEVDGSGLHENSSVLLSGDQKNHVSEIGNNVVRDDNVDLEASQIICPLKAEDALVSNSLMVSVSGEGANDVPVRNDGVRDVLTDLDASKMTSPAKYEDAGLSNSATGADGIVAIMGDDASVTDCQRGFESRDRKKSKYLSPPYINVSKKSRGMSSLRGAGNLGVPGGEEGITDMSLQDASPALVLRSGSRKRERKRSRKSSVMSIPLQDITASTAELLSELHLAALDCLYPCENGQFDPTEVFFARFRSSVFHDECTSQLDELCTSGQSDKVNEAAKEHAGTDSAVGLSDANLSIQVGSTDETKTQPRKRKRKEKTAITSPAVLPDGLYDVNVSFAGNCSLPADHQMMVGASADSVKAKRGRKKKEVPTQASEDFNQTTAIVGSLQEPQRVTPAIENSQQREQIVGVPVLNGNELNVTTSAADLSINHLSAPDGVTGVKKRGRKKGTIISEDTDKNPEKKKRGRKPKDGNVSTTVGSASLLNFNASNAKPISLEVCLPDVGPHAPAPPQASSNTNNVTGSASASRNCAKPNQMVTPPRSLQPTIGGGNAPAVLLPHTKSPGEAPSIDQIRKNLDYMTQMLENAGNNLSADTKVKLEKEIRGLLKKVSACPGSSSSS